MRPSLTSGPISSSSTSTWARPHPTTCSTSCGADGIPVVLVSGTVDVTEYEGRATAVMPKPFDPAELVAAARRHTLA